MDVYFADTGSATFGGDIKPSSRQSHTTCDRCLMCASVLLFVVDVCEFCSSSGKAGGRRANPLGWMSTSAGSVPSSPGSWLQGAPEPQYTRAPGIPGSRAHIKSHNLLGLLDGPPQKEQSKSHRNRPPPPSHSPAPSATPPWGMRAGLEEPRGAVYKARHFFAVE